MGYIKSKAILHVADKDVHLTAMNPYFPASMTPGISTPESPRRLALEPGGRGFKNTPLLLDIFKPIIKKKSPLRESTVLPVFQITEAISPNRINSVDTTDSKIVSPDSAAPIFAADNYKSRSSQDMEPIPKKRSLVSLKSLKIRKLSPAAPEIRVESPTALHKDTIFSIPEESVPESSLPSVIRHSLMGIKDEAQSSRSQSLDYPDPILNSTPPLSALPSSPEKTKRNSFIARSLDRLFDHPNSISSSTPPTRAVTNLPEKAKRGSFLSKMPLMLSIPRRNSSIADTALPLQATPSQGLATTPSAMIALTPSSRGMLTSNMNSLERRTKFIFKTAAPDGLTSTKNATFMDLNDFGGLASILKNDVPDPEAFDDESRVNRFDRDLEKGEPVIVFGSQPLNDVAARKVSTDAVSNTLQVAGSEIKRYSGNSGSRDSNKSPGRGSLPRDPNFRTAPFRSVPLWMGIKTSRVALITMWTTIIFSVANIIIAIVLR